MSFSFRGEAQAVVDELVKINKKYKEIQSYSANLKAYFYDTLSSVVPSETKIGEIKQSKDKRYFRLGTDELVSSTESIFQLDQDYKEIHYMPNQTRKEEIDWANMAEQLNKLLSYCDESTLKNEGKSTVISLLQCAGSGYSKIVLKYSSSTFLIEQVVLHYIDKTRIEMNYNNIQVNLKVDEKYFDLSKYLTGKKELAKPLAKYANYTFYNYYQEYIKVKE